MPTVEFSGPNNSTFFTTCCGTAICDDESRCRTCKKEIIPRSHRGRWEVAMRTLYGIKKLKEIRAAYPKY